VTTNGLRLFAQLQEYETFEDKGKGYANLPSDYQRIRCHFVFAVKHDGRRKARFVTGGHLTDPLQGSTYSSVVTIRSLRLAILAAELNGLKIWGGDIGNAYLEAFTKERIYFTAGREFGEMEGNALIVRKALYGLRTSGARFHDHFVDTIRAMGFPRAERTRTSGFVTRVLITSTFASTSMTWPY